jgi:hypothetical protein
MLLLYLYGRISEQIVVGSVTGEEKSTNKSNLWRMIVIDNGASESKEEYVVCSAKLSNIREYNYVWCCA